MIVEDGTGISGAQSYLSVSDAEEILYDLGYDNFPSESELYRASLYIDINLEPTSFILTDDQGLLWPREKFTDNQGREVEGIPTAFKTAVAVIAAEFLEEDLFDIEPAVKSESYGDSSVEYVSPQSKSGNVLSQLSYLKQLGYGASGTNSVRLIRG